MKFYSGKTNELVSFYKAFLNTRRELGISVLVLFVITFVLSLLFYAVERAAQPDIFDSWWSCIVWAYSRYIEGGDAVFDGGPATIVGRTIAFLLGVIGIAIVAIPAGIIGSGFMDAIAEEKRDKELERFHRRVVKAFPLIESRNLKLWMAKNLPHDTGAWYEGVKFKYVANNIALAKLQLKGIELKDVIEMCRKYPEFRLRNEATAKSSEEGRADRYMLEYFPVNKSYGFFVDRGSKVTIVSTSSAKEMGTGNFAYYLAKFAGFNFISKDFDIDAEDSESFYNNRWEEPNVDGLTLAEREAAGEKISRQLRNLYARKRQLRDDFISDLESVSRGADRWVICLLWQVQNQENPVDLHVAHSKADGSESLVNDKAVYDELLGRLTAAMQEHLQLSVEETKRYPLVKKSERGVRNIGYKLREDGCQCNCLTMRVSSHLMHFDSRMRVALFLMAQTIHDVITPAGTIPPEDVADMNRTGHGYSDREQQVRTTPVYRVLD